MTTTVNSSRLAPSPPRRTSPDAALSGAPSPAPRRREIPVVRIAGAALTLLGVALLGFALHVSVVAQLRHERTHQVSYADFRQDLAAGIAPVGQTDLDDNLLRPGAPVAVLRIPALGMEEVVYEGTSSGVLQDGPGHRRDTVLPGQAGVSVIMGRRAAYGGPFALLNRLTAGDQLIVFTGQGEQEYRVRGLRRPGQPALPPLPSGAGRLTLVTADGRPYLPTDVLYVDADLTSEPQAAPGRRFGSSSLPPEERAMASDGSAWIPLVLWGQGLLIAAWAVSWAVVRWGGRQAWVVGVPLITLLGLTVADQVARLLPNLY